MSGTKHIVGFSGGIDSQACAKWVRTEFGDADVILVNSNAGDNEDPLTDEFVQEYSRTVFPVIVVAATMQDMWDGGAKSAIKHGYDPEEPLDFLRMMQIKKRAPSSQARFCTKILKIKPQLRWIQKTFGPGGEFEGWSYVRYTGIRRDESESRKDTPDREWDAYFDCELIHPVAAWNKLECFAYVKGEPINPLYKMGFARVGCAPCINSRKEDIANWAQRRPEMIAKIRRWEQIVGKTYFPPSIPGAYINSIDEIVAWAQTMRGGQVDQGVFEIFHERDACESKYGLCE